MSWIKLSPLPSSHKGCLCCGALHAALSLRTPLAVGFGMVDVTRDGERIWSGDDERVWLRRFENRAAKDPDHDWRVWFNAPLYDATYQRQGEAHWVLVEKGMGFA